MFNGLLYYRECAGFRKERGPSRVCTRQQQGRGECAVDCGGIGGDVAELACWSLDVLDQERDQV